ncbi:peptide/nickel transport system ATP-binding protein/oligopeptide transport system ATP-binding protein [Promicromonospora sp. AC04]|uniref:ABC transporter ATP-binding protein n=1 Tax=Promicromonospora sp. AC04 TaxID=2135723 RepID=UPI000D4C6F47|nr:oligopeptide/dipeptide ABC transporter ATP-binding protein [Promicromonospora sp. AC04]PUB26940.1 peptide/nickel transport system ATP-binding protein/oligopeptide transport system ATP-binding protein [Promicromonospora sp. AC04]
MSVIEATTRKARARAGVPDGEPLLSVQDLKLHYPIRGGIVSRQTGAVRAVDGVSFEVFPGETLGIVGESGCGKSTTGRAIIRLENPTAGAVVFGGRDLAGLNTRELRRVRLNLQMVFQDPYSSLNPQKRIGDLLAEPLVAHGRASRKEAGERVTEMLDRVGLSAQFKGRYPHELSGGQRQRVGIARALMLDPTLLVLDEPVSALDVSIQAQVLNLLRDLQAELGLTYIFISHGLGAVRYISDRIVVMYLGKVMEVATTAELFANPRHPYTEILLDAYPAPNPHLRDKERTVVEGDVPNAAKPPSGCVFHTRCPFAQDKCRTEEPRLGGGSHAFACHFPLDAGRPTAASGNPETTKNPGVPA